MGKSFGHSCLLDFAYGFVILNVQDRRRGGVALRRGVDSIVCQRQWRGEVELGRDKMLNLIESSMGKVLIIDTGADYLSINVEPEHDPRPSLV